MNITFKQYAKKFLYLFFIALLIWVLCRSVVYIKSDEAGVLWKRFSGTLIEKNYNKGIYFISPLDIMNVYEIGVHKIDSEFSAVSKEGNVVNLKVFITYQLVEKELTILHKNIGPDYEEKYIIPELQSEIRRVVSEDGLSSNLKGFEIKYINIKQVNVEMAD